MSSSSTVSSSTPGARVPKARPEALDASKHRVGRGDSLSVIARDRLGDIKRWREIYDLNKDAIGPNPGNIRPGMVLKLPVDVEPPEPVLPIKYRVKPGDSLGRIANKTMGKFSRWTEIRDLNRDQVGKSGKNVHPGMNLKLPLGADPGGKWRVQEGETFTSIATDALGDPGRADELLELNSKLVDGDATKLKEGMDVRLPGPLGDDDNVFERNPACAPGLLGHSRVTQEVHLPQGDPKLAEEASGLLRNCSVHGTRPARATHNKQGEELTPIDHIIDATANREGAGRYDAWNPNDRGSGVSFGLVQFNQKRGALPELLRRMEDANPEKFKDVFGKDAGWLAGDEKRVRRSDLKPFKSKFQKLDDEPEFRQIQRDLAREQFFDPMLPTAKKHGIESEAGLAAMFDASIQFGPAGARLRLLRAAKGSPDEATTLKRFAEITDAVKGGHGRRENLLNDPMFTGRTIDVDALLAETT